MSLFCEIWFCISISCGLYLVFNLLEHFNALFTVNHSKTLHLPTLVFVKYKVRVFIFENWLKTKNSKCSTKTALLCFSFLAELLVIWVSSLKHRKKKMLVKTFYYSLTIWQPPTDVCFKWEHSDLMLLKLGQNIHAQNLLKPSSVVDILPCLFPVSTAPWVVTLPIFNVALWDITQLKLRSAHLSISSPFLTVFSL